MFKWVHSRKNKKGFTLLELIVVMGVLAILVAMGVPKFLGYTKDADVTAMRADVKLLEQAGLQYALHNDDSFPIAVDTNGDYVEAVVDPGVQGELGEDVTLYKIDGDKLSDFVRSLKNDFDAYGMTEDGEVFHLKGVTGSDSKKYFGIGSNDYVGATSDSAE